ncbi:MAG: hypothetical protein BRC31_03650 [Actinobacteria bacterium QS_5_72_10]|nr:MAG: hypothetical protein BRC31_03650 [Actinobacteria bacterium QS_5_72_10]
MGTPRQPPPAALAAQPIRTVAQEAAMSDPATVSPGHRGGDEAVIVGYASTPVGRFWVALGHPGRAETRPSQRPVDVRRSCAAAGVRATR